MYRKVSLKVSEYSALSRPSSNTLTFEPLAGYHTVIIFYEGHKLSVYALTIDIY